MGVVVSDWAIAARHKRLRSYITVSIAARRLSRMLQEWRRVAEENVRVCVCACVSHCLTGGCMFVGLRCRIVNASMW